MVFKYSESVEMKICDKAEDASKLLSANIVAKRLNISLRTVYRLISAGEIKAVNVGAGTIPQWRVPENVVNAFLDKRESQG